MAADLIIKRLQAGSMQQAQQLKRLIHGSMQQARIYAAYQASAGPGYMQHTRQGRRSNTQAVDD